VTLPEAVRGDSQELAAKAVQVGGVQHRAKRRAGQLLTEMKQSGERQNQGDNRKTSNGAASKATLSDPWCYPRSILKVAAARGGCPGAVLVPAAYLRDWYRSGNSAHYRIAARLLNAQARALSNAKLEGRVYSEDRAAPNS
jgi:hypothetical protein